MKLSVSVPDELWERARFLRPDLNASRLIQAALTAWVEGRAAPVYSGPQAPGEAFLKARDRLITVARHEFEKGYGAALRYAQDYPDLEQLEHLADLYFDVKAWATVIGIDAFQAEEGRIPKEAAPDPKKVRALATALGAAVSHPAFAEYFKPSVTYIRGFSSALRDLWAVVVEGEGEAASATSLDDFFASAPGPDAADGKEGA